MSTKRLIPFSSNAVQVAKRTKKMFIFVSSFFRSKMFCALRNESRTSNCFASLMWPAIVQFLIQMNSDRGVARENPRTRFCFGMQARNIVVLALVSLSASPTTERSRLIFLFGFFATIFFFSFFCKWRDAFEANGWLCAIFVGGRSLDRALRLRLERVATLGTIRVGLVNTNLSFFASTR